MTDPSTNDFFKLIYFFCLYSNKKHPTRRKIASGGPESGDVTKFIFMWMLGAWTALSQMLYIRHLSLFFLRGSGFCDGEELDGSLFNEGFDLLESIFV